jgi:hypothetical protein
LRLALHQLTRERFALIFRPRNDSFEVGP